MSSLLKKALGLLTRRNYSEFELRQKLAQFGFAQQKATLSHLSDDDVWSDPADVQQNSALNAEIDQVIDYCYRYNWLNDLDYASQYIRIRCGKGYGLRRVMMELNQKGLSEEIIEQAMEHQSVDDSIQVMKVIQKKFSRLDIKDWAARKKIYTYLMTRGFDHQSIMDVFKGKFSGD